MGFVEVIKAGSTEKLQELIDEEGLPIDDEYVDYNLLNYALSMGQKESAMMLIERGCRVNNKDFAPAADTPLHYSVKLGSIEIVELLLRKGALIHAKNFDGETALHLSAKLRNNIFTDLLLESLKDATDINDMDKSGLTYLHIACIRGNLTVILKLLENNCEINHHINVDSPELPGYTALHCAIEFYSIDAIQLLLDRNADINVKAKNGLTPLHLAVKYGALTSVKMLLRHSSKVSLDINAQIDRDSKEYSGFSALHFAVDLAFQPIFKLLLRYKPNADAKTTSGLTALHIAIRNNLIDVVKDLLNYGVDVNCAEMENSETPLHMATSNKQDDIIKMLLKQGAKVSVQRKDGSTPLIIAATWRHSKERLRCTFFNLPLLFLQNELHEYVETSEDRKHSDILHFLLSSTDSFESNPVNVCGLSHFHIACMCLSKDKILAYLQKNPEIKERINDKVKMNSPVWPGYTALHFAVENGKLDVVKVLLKYKADVRAINTIGLTPIHLTHQLTDRSRAEFILDELLATLYEEVVNCEKPKINQGLTILHVTCMQKHGLSNDKDLDDIENIEATVDLDSPMWPGCTPLHLATIFRRQKVVENLIFCAAKPNVEDARGLTPLHIACMQNHQEIANILLNDEADVNYAIRKNCEYAGKTPLHIAIGQNKPSVRLIELLLARGANINAKDSTGETPMSLFVKSCLENNWINPIYGVELCRILVLHAINLRAIDFHFSETTENALNVLEKWINDVPQIHEGMVKFIDIEKSLNKCFIEINELKSIKIDNYCSLYDLLLKDVDEMAIRVKNTVFRKIMHSAPIEKKFPMYGFLLKVQYDTGYKRKIYIENAKEAFELIFKISLPDYCTENIFKYLSNTDLGNLIDAA